MTQAVGQIRSHRKTGSLVIKGSVKWSTWGGRKRWRRIQLCQWLVPRTLRMSGVALVVDADPAREKHEPANFEFQR